LTWLYYAHSMGDMQTHHLLPRHAEPALANMLHTFPVVVVTGARQTGKSTLVRERLPGDHTYLTLDDVLLRDEARRDPELFLDRGGRLIVDEVQRAPDLLLAIKRRFCGCVGISCGWKVRETLIFGHHWRLTALAAGAAWGTA